MKTTIRIDVELYAEVKQLKARNGRTLSATIEDSLRAMLARRRAMERSPFNLATFRGNGLF